LATRIDSEEFIASQPNQEKTSNHSLKLDLNFKSEESSNSQPKRDLNSQSNSGRLEAL